MESLNITKPINNNKNDFTNREDIETHQLLDNKEEQNRKEQAINDLKRNKYNRIFIFISIIGFYFYYLSLEGCYETQTYCLVNLNPEFFDRLFLYCILSSFILALNIFLMVRKKLSYGVIVFNVIAYFGLFKYDNGDNLAYHGSYNKAVMILATVILYFIIYVIYYTIFVMIIKRKKYLTITIIIAVYVFIGFYINLKLKKSCDRWNFGLKNEVIDNSDIKTTGLCKISPPKYCWQEFLSGYLDISWYIQEDCNQLRFGEKHELFKYLKDNQQYNKIKENLNKQNINGDENEIENSIDIVGYPNTANWPWVEESYFKNYQKLVFDQISFYKSDSNNNKIPLSNEKKEYNNLPVEIFLNFNKETNLARVEIKLERNEELIRERRLSIDKINNLLKNSTTSRKRELPNKNILIVYVDCISRVHFLRKMPKTTAFIEQFYKNDLNDDFASHQFFKYHQFHVVTPWGVNPMFYGQSIYDYKGVQITKHLSELGYITGHANNICSREMYDLEDDQVHTIGFDNFDHELSSFFCDPNFTNPENPYTPYLGPYAIRKRCLYGKNTYEHVLEYGEAFWKAYIGEKRFLRIGFQDAHEGTGEVPRYLDEHLSEFLTRFYSQGLLRNTEIVFISDHGNKMIGVYQALSCDDFYKEGTLGMMFIITPKDEDYEYRKEGLENNKNLMITPYDLFPTILEMSGYFDVKSSFNEVIKSNSSYSEDYKTSIIHDFKDSIINYEYSNLANSLFSTVPNNRTCDTFSKDMKSMYCRCDDN